MVDSATASAILIIANRIYEDYEMENLTPDEYWKINNIDQIIQKYTTQHVPQIHAWLNTYFMED